MFARTSLPSPMALYILLIALPPALCHVEMIWPYPLRSKHNPSTPENLIDYSMKAPLDASGSSYPCKGYQHDHNQGPTTTYSAGSTYNITLDGSATHGGGSCQLSLSYDQGQTFRVIKSMIGGCPLKSSYDFTIPTYAPSGEALFAWSWQNKVGNREFYMDCAVVQVQGNSHYKRQGPHDNMDSLPGIWKADLQSITDCTTAEGESPVYPHPGSDVEYGDGLDSSSPPTPGECDATSPSSQSTNSSSSDPYTDYNPTNDAAQAHGPPSPSAGSPHDSGLDLVLKNKAQGSAAVSSVVDGADPAPYPADGPTMFTANPVEPTSTASTTTIYIDCPETITMTIYPSETLPISSTPPVYTTSVPPSACTGTSAACPCAPGYECRSIGTCTWACLAVGQTASSSGFRTTTNPARSSSTQPPPRASTVPPPTYSPPPSNPNRPPYASASNIQSYLPCVPGSFICSSATTWYTCDYNGATDPSRPSDAWVYKSPRTVADGMECLPFLAPYSASNEEYAQQNQSPQGYFRDDRYVRARPDGDCDVDGSIMCLNGGQEFEVCDQGGWVRMGSVAEGTTCRDGKIVGA